MRHHPRPFVVEVKRGTSRQSFQSHSLEADKFSAAEKLLFSAARVEPVSEPGPPVQPAQSGRVLPALSEMHEIVLADPFPAPRRGRPPGSKNKAKQVELTRPAEFSASSFVFDTDSEAAAELEPMTLADQHLGQDLRVEDILFAPAPNAAAAAAEAPPRGMRLRDRSRILRRYVLGIEPRAGERKSLRNRKAASSRAKRER